MSATTIDFSFLVLPLAERKQAFERAAEFFAAVSTSDGDTRKAIEQFKAKYMMPAEPPVVVKVKKEKVKKENTMDEQSAPVPSKLNPIVAPDQQATNSRIINELKQLVLSMKEKVLGFQFKENLVPLFFVQDFANDLHKFALIFNQSEKLKTDKQLSSFRDFWADKDHVKESFVVQTKEGGIETIVGAGANISKSVAENGYVIVKGPKNYYVDRLFREYATHLFFVYASFWIIQDQEVPVLPVYKQMRQELLKKDGTEFVALATQKTKYRKFLENFTTEQTAFENANKELAFFDGWPELVMPEKKGQVFDV